MVRDRAGNTAVTFAFLVPVLVLVTGGVVDVTDASLRQATLQQAVDAAAVAAVSQYSPGYQYAVNMTGDGAVPDSVTATNTDAVFNANWSTANDTSTPAVTGNACGGGTLVCKQGTGVKAYVTATATYTSSFLGMFGEKTIALSANSQASANMPTYINYYILVDVSQSMGIASTAADMATLYNRVYTYNNGADSERGCVFGCHVQSQGGYDAGDQKFDTTQAYTNEDLAHNPLYGSPVTLRIDSARAAIQSVITQAQQSAGKYQNISLGIYEMSEQLPSPYYTTVSPISPNYSQLMTDSAAIDLGPNNSGGSGDSDFSDQLNNFAGVLPQSNGVGTAQNPINYVFIITDGLTDTPGSCTDGHCTGALNSAFCSSLQKRASVGVIYTTYREITQQSNASSTYDASVTTPETAYSALVAPYVGSIPSNLKACASSPSLYFEADEGPAIVSAMANLFSQTEKTARITS